ncbi:S8 family serine peptidase [Streptomyces sp. 150FB]|uniref:S8 family serine peptidase n=1 Tax=Streptomyces sp. 150FB TaxID=1576605 RepID=UPI00099D7F32|nr:S8 family serine peptidase [Streptomyces sp. 150FB]
MTAGMSQVRKRSTPHVLRRGLLCTVAALGAWTIGVAGLAPAAAAADVQSKQWYLDAMGAKDIWKITTGEGIKVAVIDTGVNPSTPSLKGQVLPGFDATESTGGETDDYLGHGTTMAELIAGTGEGGLKGLAPSVKIIPIRVNDPEFDKTHKVNPSSTSDAIRAAVDSDAQIISMSFGTPFADSRIRAATEYAMSKGKLFFASTGNNAEEGNKPEYPAAYQDVIGVASADRKGKVAEYSQNGDDVDLASPGNEIPRWCDATFKSYCDGEGTSPATAIASASAALVWSVHPTWTANQVLRVLFDTAGRTWADNERSKYLGHGLIRPATVIVDKKGDPGAADISPLTNQKTPVAATAPTSSAPAPSQPAKSKPADKPVVAASSQKTGDSQVGLIVGLVAVVVVVLAGGGFLVARRRRSS